MLRFLAALTALICGWMIVRKKDWGHRSPRNSKMKPHSSREQDQDERKDRFGHWYDSLLDIAGLHTQVAGSLAGFSITVVAIITTLSDAGQSTPHLHRIAVRLSLTSFLGYVATAIVYSVVIQRQYATRVFLYSVGSSLYYISVIMTFASLLPLANLVGVDELQFVDVLVLSGASVAGFFAAAVPIHDMLEVNKWWVFSIFTISIILGSIVFPCIIDSISTSATFATIIFPACSSYIVITSIYCFLTFYDFVPSSFKWLQRAACLFLGVGSTLAAYLNASLIP